MQETEESVVLREEESGMCSMVVRSTERHYTSASLQFGLPLTYLMLQVGTVLVLLPTVTAPGYCSTPGNCPRPSGSSGLQ